MAADIRMTTTDNRTATADKEQQQQTIEKQQVQTCPHESLGKQTIFEFNCQTQFIFSELGESKDNIPQLAHVDIKETSVNKLEEDCLGVKACIGFTPINLDGMMLQVWTEGKCKKYQSTAEVVEDEQCINNEKEPKPGQYVLYIPCGVLVVLPGDIVHAGGFCFGRKLPCPSTVHEVLLQNHYLHFIFCCSHLAFQYF